MFVNSTFSGVAAGFIILKTTVTLKSTHLVPSRLISLVILTPLCSQKLTSTLKCMLMVLTVKFEAERMSYSISLSTSRPCQAMPTENAFGYGQTLSYPLNVRNAARRLTNALAHW
jgi:hypothetical protein